jgi:putative addiction module component (TIGR02574 family)
MTKNQISDLHNLSVKDKIKVVHTLWDDIAKEQSIDSLSNEHKKLLDKRIKTIDDGIAQFKPWSEIHNKYQNIL